MTEISPTYSPTGPDRTIRSPADLDGLDFDKADGLVPVVVQDSASRAVLMVDWANREALEATLSTGRMHFWSRSRGELWRKGETSGNVQELRSLHADCDADTVLALVDPTGPACHTGERTCFGSGYEGAAGRGPHILREREDDGVGDDGGTSDGDAGQSVDILTELWSLLESRESERPEGSYTTRLLDDENLRLKKLGEEATELVMALSRSDTEGIPEEAADLVYHLLVALLASGVSLDSVLRELRDRRG